MAVTSFEFMILEGIKSVHKASNLLSPKFAQLGIGTLVLTDAGGALDLGGAAITGAGIPTGQILIGNASGQGVPETLSGDVTVDMSGVVTISMGVVTTAKLADSSITKAKLDQSVAGQGLHLSGTSGQIEVLPDSATLTIINGVLQVAQSGIDTTHIAAGAVTTVQLSPGLQAEVANHELRITNLEAEVAQLTTAVAAIQANQPVQYVTTSLDGQTQVNVTGFTFDPSNTVLDLEVSIDGRVQAQDTAGGTTLGYTKTSSTQVTLSAALSAGKTIVIFKRGTSSGPSVTQVVGNADLTNITVPVAPITNGAESLGQPQKAWAALYLKDSASSQVYELVFVNNQLQLNPV